MFSRQLMARGVTLTQHTQHTIEVQSRGGGREMERERVGGREVREGGTERGEKGEREREG